jgi:hypothetical protein
MKSGIFCWWKVWLAGHSIIINNTLPDSGRLPADAPPTGNKDLPATGR